MLSIKILPSGILNVNVLFHSTDVEEKILRLQKLLFTATFSPEASAARKASSSLTVPRIGVRFRLPATMNNVEYLARVLVKIMLTEHRDQKLVDTKLLLMICMLPIPSSENGHRTDTRWVSLTGKNNGLLVVADNTIGFNALRNSVEDFDSEEATHRPYQWNNFSSEEIASREDENARNRKPRQTHINDITPQDFVEVCIDMKQHGVAGYNSWGARPLPEYSIPANKNYSWGFTLIPISEKSDINSLTKLNY